MNSYRILRIATVSLLAASVAVCAAARADSVADFYTGKSIHLLVGYPAGSGYDVAARVLAKHLRNHIPGRPSIIVENMVGAASVRAAMYLYRSAPRDGTYIASVSRSLLIAPLLDPSVPKFDPFAFHFLGSLNGTTFIGFSWAAAGVNSLEHLSKVEINVGATQPGSDSFIFSSLIKKMVGTKLKIVTGYPGSNEVFLAGERNEVQGYFGVSLATVVSTRGDLLTDKKINVLVQFAETRDPAIPDVPLITDYIESSEQLQAAAIVLAPNKAARPYLAPPGIPTERADALSIAFDKTMQDQAFLNDAKAALLEVSPMTGPAVRNLLERVYKYPPAAVAIARDAIGVQ